MYFHNVKVSVTASRLAVVVGIRPTRSVTRGANYLPMNTHTKHIHTILIALALPVSAFAADRQPDQPNRADDKKDQPNRAGDKKDESGSTAVDFIAQWPERPRLGAWQMIAKYGVPQEATQEKLTWHHPGIYKRITVTKSEDHHDFPLPHMDYMEHTIDYKVPAEKADELMKFDGSVTFDKTRGEMSARCDLEGHNILTLNIAHDIVSGNKSVEEARKAFGENVADDMAGKYPAYTTALQFEPMKQPKDSDKPSIPGAPKRAVKAEGDKDAEVKETAKASGDAEILSLLLAVDTNEVVAAMEAAKKKLSPEVTAYAKMLHMQHGKHAGETMKLGQKIDITPMDTEKVNALRIKGAGELASLIQAKDEEFGAKYIAAMIQGHTEVLEMIDTHCMKTAENEALKKHLAETREHIAMHLATAKEIQEGSKKAASN